MDERPVWRQLFDTWEKDVAPRVEEYVQTDEFAERMAAFQQMNRRMTEMAEEATRYFLRFWNLPTATDLEKVNQQLAEIDRRLRALDRPVAQEAPAPGPRKRQGSKTVAGMKAAVESREAAARRAEEAATNGGATVETEEPLSSAAITVADTSTASDPTLAEAPPAATAKASKARTTKAKATKATTSKARARKATPTKASASASRRRSTERDAGSNPEGTA